MSSLRGYIFDSKKSLQNIYFLYFSHGARLSSSRSNKLLKEVKLYKYISTIFIWITMNTYVKVKPDKEINLKSLRGVDLSESQIKGHTY